MLVLSKGLTFPGPRCRRLWDRRWFWVAQFVVLSGYLALYLTLTDSRVVRADRGLDVTRCSDLFLRTLLPGLFGGPWSGTGALNTVFPNTAAVAAGPVRGPDGPPGGRQPGPGTAWPRALDGCCASAAWPRTLRCSLRDAGDTSASWPATRATSSTRSRSSSTACVWLLPARRVGATTRPSINRARSVGRGPSWRCLPRRRSSVSGLVTTTHLAEAVQHRQSEDYVDNLTWLSDRTPGASVLLSPVPST